MTKRKIILVLAVCLSTTVFTVQTLSQTGSPNRTTKPTDPEGLRLGAKTADGLTVRWSSVTYRKILHNPAVPPEDRGSRGPESLSLSCEIEMADPRLLLGTAEPRIEKITDSQGNNVKINKEQPSIRMYFRDMFLQLWLNEKNLDRRGEPWKEHPERHPPGIRLDGTLRKRVGGEIGLLRGHYIGLMAESIYHVDLPFKTCDNWVRLTDDVEIRIIQARNVPGKHYYKIELRPEDAPTSLRMIVGDDLPSRLIVSPMIITRNSSGFSASGFGRTNGVIGGSGIGRADGIRFVMAVNPVHAKIPFEFRDIPLSAPTQSTPSRTRSSNRTARLPVMRHLQNRTLTRRRYEADKTHNRAKPVSKAKHVQLYDVNWHSINYRLTLYNPAVSRKDHDQKLLVRCDAKILNPELVMGTCEEPIIEHITDSKGRDTDISRAQPRSDRMYYDTPQYSWSRTPTPPSTLVQLEGRARSALRLPLRRRHLPKRKTELQPVGMIIRLDPALMGQYEKEIRHIEGYFHALTAESYKHIEVPFKANNRWVRLTSDLEIQVAKAWHDGVKYRYEIKERSQAQIRPGRLHAHCPLPDGILVERRFTGPDAPPKSEHIPRGARSLPRLAGGRGSVGRKVDGVDCRIDTIDYLIAVGPSHHRIPFEFEHIPLPEL